LHAWAISPAGLRSFLTEKLLRHSREERRADGAVWKAPFVVVVARS
jgi:hypothetical protein